MKRLTSVALVVLALSPAPAVASTIPPLELAANKAALSVGLLDLNVDMGLTDRFSLGASIAGLNMIVATAIGGAVRGTFNLAQLGDRSQFQAGLTLSAGGDQGNSIGGSSANLWVQPAVNVSYSPIESFTMRATLGPLIGPHWDYDNNMSIQASWWPNLELAFGRLANGWEFTVGGNSLLGIRWLL